MSNGSTATSNVSSSCAYRTGQALAICYSHIEKCYTNLHVATRIGLLLATMAKTRELFYIIYCMTSLSTPIESTPMPVYITVYDNMSFRLFGWVTGN